MSPNVKAVKPSGGFVETVPCAGARVGDLTAGREVAYIAANEEAAMNEAGNTRGETVPGRKRPVLVWIIFIFYLISSVQVIVAMFFVAAGGVDMAPEQQAYLAKFTVMDRVIGYVNAGLSLVGVSLLFSLRKQAVNVLALAFSLNLFSTAVVWLRTDPAAVTSVQGLIGQGLGIAMFGLLVFYAWRLNKRGLLA